MRIEQALDKYVLQLRGNGRSDHTIAQVRRHVRLFESWLEGDDELAAIDHETVALFLAGDTVTKRADGKARKPTSANALRSSLRCFFAFTSPTATTTAARSTSTRTACATSAGTRRRVCHPQLSKRMLETR